MSGEKKKIIPRLGKAAKEFNIATSTIVEFLKEKGHSIENNDNTKLTLELYELINQKYKTDKDVKEESEKIEIGSGLKTVSSSDEITEPSKDQEVEDTEVIIKQTSIIEKVEPETPKEEDTKEKIDFKAEIQKPNIKTVGKIDLEKKSKPKKKDKKEDKSTVEKETKKVKKEATKETKTKEKKLKTETKQIEIKEEEQKSEEKITETIQVEQDILQEEPAIVDEQKEQPVEEETEQTISAEENPLETDRRDVEKVDFLNKIETKQPVVLGKIDLGGMNTRTKPKKKTAEELRAERKEKREKELELKKQQQELRKKQQAEKALAKKQSKTSVDELHSEIDSSDSSKKTASSSGSIDRKDKKEKRKRIKTSYKKESDLAGLDDEFKKRKDRHSSSKGDKRNVFTEEDIDKQVRKTYARMAPTGKTRASKYRREKRELIQQEMSMALEQTEKEKNILKVTEFITANELANMMNIPVTQIITTCMSVGLAVAINQRLGAETISLLAEEFGFTVQFVGVDEEEEEEIEEVNPEDLVERSPIVTVMGHVDHGKTSLLDYIRKTNVITDEAGGITQHIGAYEVTLPSKKRITFLDTPGHEAFTAMRARGAKVTDIVIIVIAADDSIMPQTVEAINHAQAAGVPIIFAINKIDKPAADPEKIRSGLANMNLLVEEWGGKIQSQDISAKKGMNIDVLLEKVLIEAEMLDLKANPDTIATGTVVESSLDKGRGYVAKILVQNGTLNTGDVIAAGTACGKIRAMYNGRNQLITEAGPSVPVLILGLNNAPQAGDAFRVYREERDAKNIVNKRIQLLREQGLRTQKHITLDEIGRRIAIGDFKELNIIIKGDVDGSIEALADSILRLSTSEIQINVIHKSVGQVVESDVLLASASDAIIIAFQVRPSGSAKKLAEQEQVDIRIYSIIYDAINDLKD
ncbi:MAG: translation initiation factor IF-2, partial [Bacteroidales bacterium]|nr:translation initiation factor IF-2 [Bacteroidales bacterium]